MCVFELFQYRCNPQFQLAEQLFEIPDDAISESDEGHDSEAPIASTGGESSDDEPTPPCPVVPTTQSIPSKVSPTNNKPTEAKNMGRICVQLNLIIY